MTHTKVILQSNFTIFHFEIAEMPLRHPFLPYLPNFDVAIKTKMLPLNQNLQCTITYCTPNKRKITGHYYPFKKYVEYIFFAGCLSLMSCAILRLRLAALTKHDVVLGTTKFTVLSTSIGSLHDLSNTVASRADIIY